ncbi:MAG: HAD-IA family hydrolase [Bacilli bacterium]|jgi:HAD superfamily hydrolase (TIGR01549 family)|nr:HAD-IA family hydrolase [Bacilli bacterium]
MYKLVLFDMDGTIADTDGMIVATFIEMYRLYRPDYSPTINHMLTFSGPPIFDTLAREFPDLSVDFALSEFKRLSLPNYLKHAKPFPYIHQLTDELQKGGVKIGVVTSKHRYPAEYTLQLIKLEGVFDLLVSYDDVKEAKPNPEGIYQAMKHFEVDDKREVLYVGDTVTDYLTARNAGVDIALVTWTPREIPANLKPDYLLDSFNEFFEVINNGKAN